MRLAARGALIWAAWTLYAVFSASQNFVSRAYSARISFTPALKYALLDCYLWAGLTPILFLLAGRLVVRRANWWWSVPLLFPAGLVFGMLHLFFLVRLLPMIGYHNSFRAEQAIFVSKFHSDALTCWTLFAIRHGIEYYRRY